MTYHVIPINDIVDHDETTTCSCMPEIEYTEGGMIIIHNAYDGREYRERLLEDAHQALN